MADSDVSSIPAESLTLEQAIANLRQTEDPDLRYYAAWWLGRFRVNQPEVVDLLELALADESSRSPDGGYPLRRNAARALGKLGERRVIPVLLGCVACEDYYVREAAIESLGELGEPSEPGRSDRGVVSTLLGFLAGGVDAAVMVPGKPHLCQPYDAILETLGMLGATEAIAAIQPFMEHPTGKVQYAAARALYQLTGKPEYGEVLVRALEAPDLQLRRAALMDIGAVGYLGGAEAIATTLAENSLKIIALKGLLETHLRQQGSDSAEPNRMPDTILSEDAIRVMTLMDSLL